MSDLEQLHSKVDDIGTNLVKLTDVMVGTIEKPGLVHKFNDLNCYCADRRIKRKERGKWLFRSFVGCLIAILTATVIAVVTSGLQ